MSEPREYENGVADVLAFLLADVATVTRDVSLYGHLSEVHRQIDVLVQFHLPREHSLAVDCKRWGTKVDVRDVGTFLDLLKDTEVDSGLLVTTNGASKAAMTRAAKADQTHIKIMPLQELNRWRPPGTVQVVYRLDLSQQTKAERVLRKAGFRVVPTSDYAHSDSEVLLEAFRHYGTPSPSGDVQSEGFGLCEDALGRAGITFEHAANGVVIGGGTPAHQWLKVTVGGIEMPLKLVAANEDEVRHQLDTMANSDTFNGVSRSKLDVIRPPGWPGTDFFDALSLGS